MAICSETIDCQSFMFNPLKESPQRGRLVETNVSVAVAVL